MSDKFEIGMTGEGRFRYERKGFHGYIRAFGKILDIDGRYLLFEDNDGFPYLVRKDKFEFTKEELKIKI